jgi:hypothetical protein
VVETGITELVFAPFPIGIIEHVLGRRGPVGGKGNDRYVRRWLYAAKDLIGTAKLITSSVTNQIKHKSHLMVAFASDNFAHIKVEK